MTIEEKAKEYAGTQDSDAYAGFVDGAEWMQEKAAEWFTNYLGEIGYPDDWLRDSKVQQSGMERFRKAMEE